MDLHLSQNISIRTKLASLVALNVAVLAVVAFYCVRQVRFVRREIHEIAEQDIPLNKALAALAEDQEDMDARLERVLRLAGLSPAGGRESALAAARATARAEFDRVDDREAEHLREGWAVVRRGREAAAAAGDSQERAEFDSVIGSLQRIEKEYDDYRRQVGEALALVDRGRPAEAAELLPRVEQEEADLDAAVAALTADVEGFTAASAHHAEVHEREVIRQVAAAGAGGVAGALVLGFVYAQSITRRLRTAVGVANRLAAGDRHFEVPVEGRDEAGALLRAMRVMAGEIAEDEDKLKEEQQRSERLLLNILPRSIAERLKGEHRHIADGFAEVSVLFADVVGFTALSSRMPPAELVRILNDVFCLFDRLAEKHGLEKIKTIGDCYMAVAGIPHVRADHAPAVAEMALEMLGELGRFDTGSAERLSIRIGINSGPVVAGVIGIRKFIYDLWGDTVNVASRMESHGVPGEIQVSEATYRILRHAYVFEDRGTIHIKGKGDMAAYLLKGRRASPTDEAGEATARPPVISSPQFLSEAPPTHVGEVPTRKKN